MTIQFTRWASSGEIRTVGIDDHTHRMVVIRTSSDGDDIDITAVDRSDTSDVLTASYDRSTAKLVKDGWVPVNSTPGEPGNDARPGGPIGPLFPCLLAEVGSCADGCPLWQDSDREDNADHLPACDDAAHALLTDHPAEAEIFVIARTAAPRHHGSIFSIDSWDGSGLVRLRTYSEGSPYDQVS